MTANSVFLLLLIGLSAEPAEKPNLGLDQALASESEPKQAPKRRLLRKRGAGQDTSKRRLPPGRPNEPVEEEAPQVPRREIPAPDAITKPSDLDRELLEDLSKNSEKTKAEESDPLLRAGRRMRSVEEKLARLDANEETMDLQKRIVADLEELLKRMNQRPSPQNQSQKNEKDRQQQKQQQNQQQRMASVREATNGAVRPGPPRSAREKSEAQPDTRDIWGHLSEMLRQDMRNYFKDGFLPAYQELLEQYYTTISVKSNSSSE